MGDPEVGKARYKGKITNFIEFLGARKEAETIGQLLGIQPLLGERATRDVVLQAIYPVSLIRVVAHGNADTGEIALLPCPTVKSAPDEEGYPLRISDISEVKVRAKLVLPNYYHSGVERSKSRESSELLERSKRLVHDQCW